MSTRTVSLLHGSATGTNAPSGSVVSRRSGAASMERARHIPDVAARLACDGVTMPPVSPDPDPVVDLTALPDLEIRETHGSRVFLSGNRAWKVRKPVRFPFLDQTTLEARRRLSLEELRLNAELAPSTYLAVRRVVGPDGDDVAVEMRRFEEGDTLASRVMAGRVPAGALERLGARLATFHDARPPLTGGGVRAALSRVEVNTAELAEHLGPDLPASTLWDLSRPLEVFALRHAAELEARAGAGRWREGHGDLRADHVVLDDDGIRIVDCLEFDRGLRVDDVGADLAFLLMDLESRGAPEAAATVLHAYRGAGGDPGSDALVAFWAAYRAMVSLKVALLRRAQSGAVEDADRVRTLIGLARALGWRTRGPRVVIVCGAPACGKSTLAAVLAQRSGLPVHSSDVVRKTSLGLAPLAVAPPEAYAPQQTHAVYAALGTAAARAVAAGRGVIIDATMGSGAHRRAFVEAASADLGSPTPSVFVECRVPAAEARRRAEERAARGPSTSDATPQIADRLRRAWEPLDEVEPGAHLTVRADQDPATVASEIEAHLDASGAGRHAFGRGQGVEGIGDEAAR